jgi:isoamylase
MHIEAGRCECLGAFPDAEGSNFALFSAHAEAVELCLFDASGQHQIASLMLPEKTHDIWHGYVPGLPAGTNYGYRVHGPYDPRSGQRFNPSKLLLDPYARQMHGAFVWNEAHFAYDRNSELQDLLADSRDNAAWMPKGVVTAANGSYSRRCRLPNPWHQTVLYEVHPRGFTMLHPDVPESLRGSFAGLSQARVIEYLRALGITSVELLPVHAHIDERFLQQRGLSNYWGYNSLNFFTPHPGYLSGGDVQEFREFVERFHDAGLEVILDVVFNHTCEGNHLGPTLSFRGIDNLSYYQLLPGERRFYVNDSGCGNTMNVRHPRVMQLFMDSLRYWAGEMGVDGFRFDLASVLGRGERGFDSQHSFFQMLAQDPLLGGCKLIAEPWDLGPGGYQLGNFPAGWGEWNDRYRDTLRRYWRGDKGELPELARRLHGSGDIFEHSGRRPYASINFITSHDGFTLRDLVSYNQRHNEANGEDNQDGPRENISNNQGVEGPSDDPLIDERRWRQQCNLMASLLLSQGTPMLLAGDEFGRSQSGNNNAYCQDNPLSWLDWNAIDSAGQTLQAYTRKLLAIRRAFPVLQADRYRHLPDHPRDDSIEWLNADGLRMRDEHWHEAGNRLLGYLLADNGRHDPSARRYLLVLLNAAEARSFQLPVLENRTWTLLLDSARPSTAQLHFREAAGASVELQAASLQVLTAGPERELTPR